MSKALTLDNVPESLASLPQWVVWKTTSRNGKPIKVPFQADGSEAKSNDPATWTTFDAVRRLAGYDGPGFVFSHYDSFTGVDLDGCRNPETGTVADWAREIITELNSYSEVSPSRTGVKIFVEGKSPFDTGKKRDIDVDRVTDDKQPGIEIYSHTRYFAVTGWRLKGVSLHVEKRDLYWLRERFWPAPVATSPGVAGLPTGDLAERARKYVAKLPPAISGQSGHNATFHAACVLRLGFGLAEHESLPLLQEYNQRCEPPWSEHELTHKLVSAGQQTGPRNYLRDAKPADWDQVKVPTYTADEPTPTSQPAEQKARITLEGATQKYLKQVEENRTQLLSLGLPDVDYAIGGGVAQGEVVILAARPSHGKSAVALQCIHSITADSVPSLLISEEMSSLAIGKRTILHVSDVPEEHWKTSIAGVRQQLDGHFEKRALCHVLESCGHADIAAEEIRRAVSKDNIGLAVIDYAQLLKSKGNSRYEQVTNTSITLRQVATETGVVLLLLCQLSRAVERRDTFMPTMADLKETGQLEQDSDVILFLCWPHRLDPQKDPKTYLVFVGKNRNRAINQSTVTCEFNPSRQKLVHEPLAYPEFTEYDSNEPPKRKDLF